MVLTPPAVPPTALWVVPVSDIGGVARHVTDVVRQGIPGWRVVTLCPPGPLADRLRQVGGAVVVAPVGPAAGLAASLRSLRRTVGRLRPAIIHSHLAYADIVTALGAPRGSTLVSTEHGISGDPAVYHDGAAKQKAMATAHSVRLRRLSALITVSHSTADVIRQRWSPPPTLPIHVVHNGIEPLADPPGPTPGLRIGSLSRLAPEKNVHVLVEAFAHVLRQHPHATLTIAGSGPEEPRIKQQVDQLDLQRSVMFPGVVEPEDFFPRIDVLAQLSSWENHSYTLLEALNHGCGVVATDVGGNHEIVDRSSLVPLDPALIATRLVEQGLDLSARPRPADQQPGVAEMTARIAEIYDGAQR